jgi:hypothetical protein
MGHWLRRSLGLCFVLLLAICSLAVSSHPVASATSHRIAAVTLTEPNGPLPPQPM